jgi:NAD(P)-dependent dehydrogenase (short-subunit alcohol dehydrogenase family)
MFEADLMAGHVCMVTGGGSGLGRAIAERLLHHGACVAILGRREALLQECARNLGPGRVLPIRCDVRYADEVQAALARTLERFGHVDSLVNAAAGNFVSPTERLGISAFKLVIDTVLMGTLHCTLTLGKHWIETGRRGSVLSIVTNYASTGSPYVVPSGCAKAGVENMTRSLAAEWGRHGLRLVGISPGPFPTDGAMGQLRLHEQLLPGVDIPTFLLSPGAEYINGEIVRIDGGEAPCLAGEFSFMHGVPASVWEREAGRLKRQPSADADHAPPSTSIQGN